MPYPIAGRGPLEPSLYVLSVLFKSVRHSLSVFSDIAISVRFFGIFHFASSTVADLGLLVGREVKKLKERVYCIRDPATLECKCYLVIVFTF